ncbi:hypothetical protein GCM10029964_080840 [Kibdelosporangium lantanae]
MAKTGAGLEPIWQPFLTVENLTDALRKLANDGAMADAAKSMQAKLESEPGHAKAISIIEQVAKVPTTA